MPAYLGLVDSLKGGSELAVWMVAGVVVVVLVWSF
jgi:hypothetical protein